jgi:hypothetical protein
VTIYRQYLTFSRKFERPNTFLWLPELETIRCRIKVASAEEVSPVDVHLRFRRRGATHGLVHIHPHDESTFITEAAVLHESLPKLELVLCDVPPDTAQQMRAL